MNTKTLMKEVYHKTETGKFADVLQLIKGVEVTKDVALNILICASKACYSNCNNSSNDNDIDKVYDLLNNIVCYINIVDQPQLVRYLQATFHVIKYMCEKEWFEDLTKMDFLIFPTFLRDFQLQSIEGCKHVYEAITKQLCSSIIRLSEAAKTIYNKYLLRLVNIIFKANSLISGSKQTSIAQKILNCFNNLKFRSNQLCEFYFIVLNNVARDVKRAKDYTEEIPVLTHIFSTIISDIIESREFQTIEMFLDSVETRVRSGFVQQEFLKSHLMFKAVTAIFPSDPDKMQESTENCKILINDFSMRHKKIFLSVIRFLEEPFCNLLLFYKSSEGKSWLELPSDSVINVLRLFRENICCHLVNAPTKCSCGCSLEKNYAGTLKIGCQVSGLLKYYADHSKRANKKVCSEMEQWLTCFYEILKDVKEHNCKKWSQIYKELGTYTYNIGTVLYRQENVAFVDIYQCFLKYSLEFDGFAPELLKPNLNEVTFNVICELEYKNRNIEKCMAFAALYCLLYPQNCNSVFQNWWIKSKIKVKEDSTIQQQTLVSVLEKHELTVSGIINPHQYLHRKKKLELLTYELLRYRAVWKSKESLMAAFSQLVKIADIPEIARVILEIFGDGDLKLHEEMPVVFLKVTKKIEEYLNVNPDHYLKMALAVICFYNYKESARETADENLQEMEKTMQVMESAKEKFEPIPKDPNDECDIVSAYSNLRLSKFIQILKPLNKCVDLIDSLTTQSYEPQIIKNISKLLTIIGFEYCLHCFSIKSLQAFELSLKFAYKIGDIVAELLAISFLIENADIRKNFVKEMIARGDQAVRLLTRDNINDKDSKTIAIYHISKANAFLYEDANLSLESWKIADALVTANEMKDEFKFLRAQLYILHYKLTKSCNFIDGEHEKYPMTIKLHCAMDIVITLSHKNILCSHELCILFDTVYELAKVYYLMRLPRDLRAYSKNSVLLTQKIVLPMRCVSFLILLAHSDLLTCKFDHCNVKLNGVIDIFCLSQSRPLITERIELKVPDAKITENEMDTCINQIQEMALDFPQHTRQYSPSSPALVVESFKTPPFLSHEKSCMCFICLSFEYHQLLLQKYHLDALFNMYEKDEKLAEDFICGAITLYKTLMRNYDGYKEKAKRLISESLIIDFDDSLREYYGNILYDYSFHLIRKSQKQEALKINTELIQLVKPKKFQHVYLYNDALLQRLSYIIPAPNGKSAPNEVDCMEIENTMDNFSLKPNENISIQKTPINKKSSVTVTINGVPKNSPPKRRIKKKCVLFNSSSDVEDTLKKSPSLAPTPKSKSSNKNKSENNNFALPKAKGKKSAIPVFGTPLLGDPQTPKISIFTDAEPAGSVRKSRRKQSNVTRQLSGENSETNECSDPINPARKSTRAARTTLNTAMVVDENIDLAENEKKNDGCHPGNTTKKSTRNVRKTAHSADILDENIDALKENCDHQQLPIIAGSSKNKASTTQCKTTSTAIRKRLVDGLLADKIPIPTNGENISSNTNECETSSVISESPEHQFYVTKSKAVLEKITASAKKAKVVNKDIITKVNKSGPEVKKNLLGDFVDNAPSSSKSTKHTGAIRKSTRNRIL